MEEAAIWFHIGPLAITSVVVTTWGVMAALGLFCALATQHLALDPGPVQTVLEGAVSAIEAAIEAVLPERAQLLLPFIGTLWIYILVSNLLGIIPGLHGPTGNLSVTSGLALLVFLSVHWFGARSQGVRRYLRHYLSPSPILLPFHLISEVTRTAALAVRLFGNIMSLEMAALLVLLVAGVLAPVPLMMLHIVEAMVQAYIFGMLALIYVAGAMQSQQNLERDEEGDGDE
ncbi:F0F1 ATP synthase subunit A [Candidatus Ferrigenium straubiae]|jgi:F-type H+-transporting ATPase subunit a|uniref:F0F1 ATP synthase subunit A n=1 Tax=Candidatus Ferrigenium straubiae TaxID=2919506 RepID=UPI003F4AB460